MNANLPYAEDVAHYWKTSETSPDNWILRACGLIKSLGGEIISEGFGSDHSRGASAYMISFRIGVDEFRIIWPVLPTKTNAQRAARIQSATMLYHDVKNRCMIALVMGTRFAFFNFLLLPNGKTASEVSGEDLLEVAPRFLLPAR